MQAKLKNKSLIELVVEIVAAHVSNNHVEISALGDLIRQTYASLHSLSAEGPAAAVPTPAVPVKKSVTADYIICLEDGKKMKMLKRHLTTAFNLTPDQYRKRWGLPADYPMVAPNYAEQRRTLAKKIGLGRSRQRKNRVQA
jgi:predicted transcriptional regulator